MTAPLRRGAVPVCLACRAPARRAEAARRQVDLASGADPGRPGRGREPDHGAGDGRDVQATAGDRRRARGDGGAGPRGRPQRRLPRRLARAPTASTNPTACSTAATPEPACGCAPACSPGCPSSRSWTAMLRCGAVRWPVSSNRCARWARRCTRVVPIPSHRWSSSVVLGSRHRLHDPRTERPGQVGDPAGGPARGRADDGARGGGHARPHRADAPVARHRGPA
jgi:hypothetical protein